MMWLLLACGPSMIDDPLQDFPGTVGGLGLDQGDGVHPRATFYEPEWPLWSSGSDKTRWVVLPEGQTVDDDGAFPIGTLFFKRFAYDDKTVETRVMRLGYLGWEFASYKGSWLWDADYGDVARTSAGDHTLPARLECRSCHESSPDRVLGWDQAQVDHDDPQARAVLGYLQGNCVSCHNGSGGPSSSFSMLPDDAFDELIGVPTESSGSASGLRVDPGSPETSVLFLGLSQQTDDPEIEPMPPLGIDRVDQDGVALMRAWIESL